MKNDISWTDNAKTERFYLYVYSFVLYLMNEIWPHVHAKTFKKNKFQIIK